MPGHIITELTNLAGPSNQEELEIIQVNFLENNLLTQRNNSHIKSWLEENDFEVFKWAITNGHFKLFENFLNTAEEYNLTIARIINTTLSSYNSTHLLNLINYFNQNPTKNEATNEFLDIISEIISNAEEINELEQYSESTDSDEFEFESPLTSPDLYKEATATAAELTIPTFVHRKSAFKEFNKRKEDEKDPSEFPIATFSKEGSAFRPIVRKKQPISSVNNSSATEDENEIEKRIATILEKRTNAGRIYFTKPNYSEEHVRKNFSDLSKIRLEDLIERNQELERVIKTATKAFDRAIIKMEKNPDSIDAKKAFLQAYDAKQEFIDERTISVTLLKILQKENKHDSSESAGSKRPAKLNTNSGKRKASEQRIDDEYSLHDTAFTSLLTAAAHIESLEEEANPPSSTKATATSLNSTVPKGKANS